MTENPFANPKAGEWLGSAFDAQFGRSLNNSALSADKVREIINTALPGLENRFELQEAFGGEWLIETRLVLGQRYLLSPQELEEQPEPPARFFVSRFRREVIQRLGLEEEMLARERTAAARAHNEALGALVREMRSQARSITVSAGFLEAVRNLEIEADKLRKRGF